MPAPAALERAAALERRATAQMMRSRFDLASRSLLAAWRLLEETSIETDAEAAGVAVRVLTTLSTVEMELHGSRDGLARLEQAEQIARRSQDEKLIFTVENNLSLRSLRDGRHAAALEHFALAEEYVEYAGSREACSLFLNRGNLRLQRLELEAARSDFERCIQLAAETRTHSPQAELEFMARHNLGYLEFLAGNLPLSLRLMDEAAAISTGVSLAISALDRARVLIEAGLSDAADSTLAGAAVEFRRGRLYQELAETELARAECSIMAANLTRARQLAASARNRFRRRGNERWWRLAELTLLSADLAAGRPGSRLIGPAERLAWDLARDGLHLQAKTAELIACAAMIRAGRLDQATARLARLPPVRPSDPIAIRLQQRAVTAGLLKRTGRVAEARSAVRAGLSELSRHQAQFGSIDLQTASAIHGRRLVQLDLDLSLADHRPATIFNAIERGRAVSRRLTAVTAPKGESAELLAELRQLSELIKAMGDDPAAESAVQPMRTRVRELYRRLEAISWRAVGPGAVSTPAPMARVAETAMAQGKVVASFCQVRGRWFTVLLGRGRPTVVPLPGDDRIFELTRRTQADLGVLAYRSLPNELRRAVNTSLTRSLTELDNMLVRPLDLPDTPLVIVPTGLTSTLPWGCLPSLRGRPVEVSPTATSWLAGALAVDTVGAVEVASFAGPGLETGPLEARAVAEPWSGVADTVRVHVGREATRDRMAEALRSATIVHGAAHGTHVRQNPLFSSLALTDGPLYAYEISDRQVAAHVVLSSCELGQATSRPGDEALGLTRVLLQLGAQCVVAGVAQVADDQAGTLMADYHRRLAAGEDSASALAAVTASGPYAPFVCFGSSWRALGDQDPLAAPAQRASKPTLR